MRLSLFVILACLFVVPVHAQLATPNEIGLRYGHVHLNVSDIEVHKRLWVEHFGGVVVQKGPLTAVRLPGMLVALTEQEPTGGSIGSAMDHIGFKVRNLDRFLAKWRATGLPVNSEFTGAEGFPNAYVMAPDDVRVELQEDQALAVEVAAYHIHFFTADYEGLLDWYAETFSLERRPRGRIETTTNVPGMNLSFGRARSSTVGTRGRSIDHIGFEIDGLEDFCRRLEARGIAFDVSYREVESVELNIAFVTDPSGVSIELTEGYDEY